MPSERRSGGGTRDQALEPPRRRGCTSHLIEAHVRPGPLAGVVSQPEGASSLVVLASSVRAEGEEFLGATMTVLMRHGIAVAAFGDLVADRPPQIDPISPFDANVLAARLVAATDALAADARFRHLPLGYFARGGSAAAAVLAAVQRPALVRAIVMADGILVAASTALPLLSAPSLQLLSRPASGDSGFLVTSAETCRETRVLAPGGRRASGHGRMALGAEHAARWFYRHLRPDHRRV